MNNRSSKSSKLRAMPLISLWLTALLVAGLGISCYSSASAPPAASPGPAKEATSSGTPSATPSTTEVTIEGFAFKPAAITIPVGSTIVWRNRDSIAHTVTAQDKVFDSGSLSSGNTFSYKFEQKGTFGYYCNTHSSMKGKVIVQ